MNQQVRSVLVALVLLATAGPWESQARQVVSIPCSDEKAFTQLLAPLEEFWEERPTPALKEARRLERRVNKAERGPLPLGLVPGALGLLRNPCPEQLVSLLAQGVSLREEGRTRQALATTLQLTVGNHPKPGPELFASLTWRPYLSEGGGSRLGPASAGFGHAFRLDEAQGYRRMLRGFLRVHLPPTFVASDALRLGVEPGVSWRFDPDDATLVFHAGATLPWLNAETLEGTPRGLHLAPTAGVTWRTPGWHVFTWEAGARLSVDGLEQVTLGGAWRTIDVFDRLALELDAVAAVAGSRRGSVMLGVRLGLP
jgi:hypothetical protein